MIKKSICRQIVQIILPTKKHTGNSVNKYEVNENESIKGLINNHNTCQHSTVCQQININTNKSIKKIKKFPQVKLLPASTLSFVASLAAQERS